MRERFKFSNKILELIHRLCFHNFGCCDNHFKNCRKCLSHMYGCSGVCEKCKIVSKPCE